MSSAAVSKATPTAPDQHSVLDRCVKWFRRVVRLILFPARLYVNLRRSMTPSSVTLLLIGIVSVNIIWGYPWTGVFSACAALMLVGLAVNRVMHPQLNLGFSLPTSAPAGSPFTVTTHFENRNLLPAMDLGIQFASRGSDPAFQSLSEPHSIGIIHANKQISVTSRAHFGRRGIHMLPDVVVTSLFPFHLFRSTRRYKTATKIAITPRPMTGDEDTVARGLLTALGNWSHRLLAGDALDYTGSREYQVGMPVRRWDYTSWARLGRPIVREFQSPSIHIVFLIIDTAGDPGPTFDPTFERLLSLAATSVTEMNRKLIRVRLYLTSEAVAELDAVGAAQTQSDTESLLIRLAAAEAVDQSESNERLTEVLHQIGGASVLLLTTRTDDELPETLPRNVTTLRVDRGHEALTGLSSARGTDSNAIDSSGIDQYVNSGQVDVS